MIKAIIFDFGDTLMLFDKWDYDKCLGKMLDCLRRQGVSIPVSYEEFKRIYFEVRRNMYNEVKDTYGEVDFCTRLAETMKRFGLDFDPRDQVMTTATDAFFEGWDEDMRIDDCVLSVLETLRVHYKLGVISNFPYKEALLRNLARFGLRGFFDAIIISDELGVRKPHSRIFEEALRTLNVKACEAVFVGDTLKTDIFGAQNVGMRTILLENPEFKKNRYAVPGDLECVNAKADRTIKDLQELTAALATLRDEEFRIGKLA